LIINILIKIDVNHDFTGILLIPTSPHLLSSCPNDSCGERGEDFYPPSVISTSRGVGICA